MKKLHSAFFRYIPHAWEIPKADLDALLLARNENGVKSSGARVYMGMDCHKLHLLMVPYADVMESGETKKRDFFATDPTTNEKFAFDFINPCPKTCDGLGALQNAFKNGKANPFSAEELSTNPCEVCNFSNSEQH